VTVNLTDELLTSVGLRSSLVGETEPVVPCNVKSQSPQPSNVDAEYSGLITAMCHAGFSSQAGCEGETNGPD
jgi:hypothetical protein